MTVALSASACLDLTVDNPQDILEQDLQDASGVPVLVSGVVGSFNWSYAYAFVSIGHFSNELIHTGSSGGPRDMDRGANNPDGTGMQGTFFNRLAQTSWQAHNALEIIREAFPDADSRAETARLLTYAGFTSLLLADNYCAPTFLAGPPMEPEEVYRKAEDEFTEALQVAQAAGSQENRLQALAGRARARLMLEDWAGAASDAAEIPAGWQMLAVYSLNSSRENNWAASRLTDRLRKEGGVDPRFYENERYISDPRFPMLNRGPDFVGEDAIRQFVEQTKYPSRTTDANISSWQEARLIEAEAELRLGNLGAAVALIDEVRADDDLPGYDGPMTSEAVLDQLMFERSVVLYLEAKHAVDRRRMGDPEFMQGRNHCLFVSRDEQLSNPNLQP